MRSVVMRCGILKMVALLTMLPAYPAVAQTLNAVKQRGTLNCGVSQGLPGFSSMDENNTWTGFDVDFCRAIAAVIFDDPNRVTFMSLDTATRFTALQSKGIDVLSRNSTWTMSREGSLGLMFAGVSYYDGQGFFLVQKRLYKGRFRWWPSGDGPARSVEAYQAQLLLAAGDPDTKAAPMWRRVS